MSYKMSAIENLRNAVEAAAGDQPFALDSAFLTTGLNDSSVKVPADYDTWLRQAFFLKAATDFTVKVAKANVGAVTDDEFTVTAATIPFVGASVPLWVQAKLVIIQDGETLVVQIASTPVDWTWTSSFAFMGSFPFNQFPSLKGVEFIFSTADGTYPFGDAKGRKVSGGAVQNLYALTPLPNIVEPFLALFTGLTASNSDLLLSGPLNMGVFNGDNVLFPPGQLTATIQNGSFDLVYLKVNDPGVAITIPAPDGSSVVGGILVLADEPNAGDQAPTLAVSSSFEVGNGGVYSLDVAVTQADASYTDASYMIGLTVAKEGDPLTPSAIIQLMGNGGGYLSATPDTLQQFLTFVELNGFTISGKLGSSATTAITSIAVDIGSSKNTSWTILPDPTGALDFTITSFSMQWSMAYPFASENRQQLFDFSTEFTLATSVFKGPEGQGNGVFKVNFNSQKQFYANFTGTAKLSDFLATLSRGAVVLDQAGVGDFELSDVVLAIDYGQQSFSFSAGYAVELNLLQVNGKPILAVREGTVRVAAKTPTQPKSGALVTTHLQSGSRQSLLVDTASTTQWQAGIDGQLLVGPLQAGVSIAYDGFVTPKRWILGATLAKPLKLDELINQYFSPGGAYTFPSFILGELTVTAFAINAVIPAESGTLQTSYDITTEFCWKFSFGDQSVEIEPAKLGISYNGNLPTAQQFSGFAQGTWVYSAIKLRLTMGYQFLQTPEGSNNILFVEWEGFRAEYQTGNEMVVFTLKGWSLGTLIQALVRTLGNPYFTLESPWSVLNQVSLDGLRVEVSLRDGESFSQRLSANYVLSSPISLGFVTIHGLTFRRDTSGKVTLAINGASPLSDSNPEFKNLFDQDKGQDVQELPTVPGQGEEWFKLFLLVLGQHIGISGYSTFKNTKEVICALQKVPSTTGKANPVDPNPDKGGETGLPYYNQSNNWLIAGHLGLMKVSDAWSIDVMLVFNDPNLYGLRLALAGEKMGGLANLVVDILYKKITDDIGVYQIEFTFPDVIRNLNFGAVSITLPQLAIRIYTNGDFFIDIGFPYNLDFSRSFSISAIIYGVPVLGAGGLYFGKLSNATSTEVPKTNLGTFDPVIQFGLGLQLGLGYNFQKGPLKAGFAITVFGIIEGVIAPWHPYQPAGTTLVRAANGGALQSDYFFKVSGTVGVIGLLYGSVDFAIISASVNVKIVLSLQLTYQCYREIPIIASASVTISLKIKVDLGLFSFSISLSFSASISATFIVGSNQSAPWETSGDALLEALAAPAHYLSGPDAAALRARMLTPKAKRLVPQATRNLTFASAGSADSAPPTLTLLAGAQYTVLAPEGATNPARSEGAFVFLLAMDAPDPTASTVASEKTSFDYLTQAFFPWIIDTLGKSEGETVDLVETLTTTVTVDELEAYLTRLADTANPALTIAELLQFLSDGFTLNIETPLTAQSSGLKDKLVKGSVLFPVFDGLSLKTPDALGGNDPSTINFTTYATATPRYTASVSELFAQVAAQIEAKNREQPNTATLDETAQSMAALVFVDSFTLIARQLLQAGADALKSYAYPLQTSSSIQTILDELNEVGNELTIADVAQPNVNHALGSKLAMIIPELHFVTQAGDTLKTVAARYTDTATPARWITTPHQLIIANHAQHMLQGDVPLTLTNSQGQPQTIITRQGDSFDDIAAQLGPITLDALAGQAVLYATAGLLTPTLPMRIPPIDYTSAGSGGASTDTLASLAQTFQTTTLAIATANDKVVGLFSPNVEGGRLTLANLRSFSVGALWDAIVATGQVGQTAGMVSRFLVYGLRLPAGPGLSLSEEFLYPKDQSGYGVYQLTGQQFPIPPTAKSYGITLSRADSSHGVNLDFIGFDSSSTTSLPIDLSAAYSALQSVVAWVRTPGNFAPTPSFLALPLAERQAKAFNAAGNALWSSGSVTRLQQLTNRSDDRLEDSSASAQVQPMLWALPPAQTNLVAAREQSIQAVCPGVAAVFKLLPQFQPQVGATNPATGHTSYEDIKNWAWCTRIDIQIKRLTDGQKLAQQTGANELPSGPASAPALPFIYELVGPNAADGVRLERILTAMHELGEDMASAVFLLYDQSGPGAPMLVTPADDDFLAFITQTNLSTETNPRTALNALGLAGDAPPRGIANSPAQFIRLLWELSTVRSGGYYLYYENVESGAGLPAAVFDSSGCGTVTVVVTFAASGEASFGNTLPNFVTSFVTTDPVDPQNNTVQTLSMATSGVSTAVTAEDSLNTLAVTYGPGPGQIAETNGSTALATNARVPIRGAVQQLTNADLVRDATGIIDAAATLNLLAKRFSAGAVQIDGQDPISGQDIAVYNPGVEVSLAAVFFIPEVTYKVTPGAAPGVSFNSMAAYYGLSVDLLARSVADQTGIFPANGPIKIDAEIFNLRDELPPQNIGIALKRSSYGPPPGDPTEPNFARNTVYQLYTSLAAGLTDNAFFKASPFGMPFGPQDHGDDHGEVFDSHARAAEKRAARLAAVADDELDYRQSLGIGNQFALVNAAPNPTDPKLPSKDANPYLGVGTVAQVALQWRDIFGNTIITPFEAPSDTYAGALNGAAAPMLYRDQLIGLGSWSNTMASYVYDPGAGNSLTLKFILSGAAYAGDSGKAQAESDLKLYSRIYFQLHQDYSAVTPQVPGVSGNAVTMRVSNSLMADAETTLTDAQAENIRAYVRDCVIYLTDIVAGQTAGAPSATVSLPIDVSKISAGNIIELDVVLTLARNPLLVEPAVAALLDGLSVAGAVLPDADGDANVTYTAFAAKLEKIFQTADWYLKVGEGLTRAGDDAAVGTQQLWAVRFGKAAGQGIYFKLGDKPSYYAPKPVAKALKNGSVTITSYDTGENQTLQLDGVDQNQWFQTTLDSIDQFLSADYAPHAFILDKLNGVTDPLKMGLLGQVLATKERLANSISGALLPVLSTSATDDSTHAAAAEKLRQQLLNQLGAAYRAGAAVVFGLTEVSGASGLEQAGPPNLYGQPTGEVKGAPGNQNFTLTPTRIPLGPTGDGKITLEPRLAFMVISKDVTGESYLPLSLDLQISHLEFDRATIPGINGYVESRWLAFVTGPFHYTLCDGVANIPVVNRNLPTPPTVSSQSAEQLTDQTSQPPVTTDLVNWQYSFQCLYQQAASDAISYTIEYNGSNKTNLTSTDQDETPNLLAALAQFITNYPTIQRDLNLYLAEIDGNELDQTTYQAALKATSAFATQTANVAAAYEASLKPKALSADPELQRVIVKFQSTLDANEEGYARTNIVNITINDNAASWDAANNTISAAGIVLPAMVIAIEPGTYEPQAVAQESLPPGVTLSYLYVKKSDPSDYLTKIQALGIGGREVSMGPLNALSLQSAWASVFVQRNLALFPIGDLGKVSTNEAFLFQTPEVRFADPIVPQLTYDIFRLDEMTGATFGLDDLLTLFFKDLFAGDAGTTVDVSMQGLYSYNLVPNLPKIPPVRLPINLLTPSPASVVWNIKPPFITPFAAVIDHWLTINQPTREGNPSIQIELKIFAAVGDAKQPLIQIAQLLHNVKS